MQMPAGLTSGPQMLAEDAPLFSDQSPVFAWGHVLPSTPPSPSGWLPAPCPAQVLHRLLGLLAHSPHGPTPPSRLLPQGLLPHSASACHTLGFHHTSDPSPKPLLPPSHLFSFTPTHPLPPSLSRVSSQRRAQMIISLPCSTILYGSPLPPEIKPGFPHCGVKPSCGGCRCSGFPSFPFFSLGNSTLSFLGGKREESHIPHSESTWFGGCPQSHIQEGTVRARLD